LVLSPRRGRGAALACGIVEGHWHRQAKQEGSGWSWAEKLAKTVTGTETWTGTEAWAVTEDEVGAVAEDDVEDEEEGPAESPLLQLGRVVSHWLGHGGSGSVGVHRTERDRRTHRALEDDMVGLTAVHAEMVHAAVRFLFL
jgi:hypothetical protein